MEKLKTTVKKSVVDSPITTIMGVIIVLGSVTAFIFDKVDAVQFGELLFLGLGLVGIRDPKHWVR